MFFTSEGIFPYKNKFSWAPPGQVRVVRADRQGEDGGAVAGASLRMPKNITLWTCNLNVLLLKSYESLQFFVWL